MFTGENNLDSLSDEQLVKKIRSEDSELYAEIVKRYQQGLYRYLRYLTNQSAEAEGLVQDVFIKAYRNLFGFDTKRKFSSWIYRIAHNEGVNYLKKAARRKDISLKYLDFTVPAPDDCSENQSTREETKRKIQKCLGELKPKYREPLVLYYFEEKSYQEISDILRIPKGTVGTLISRGRSVLKAIYQKKGGDS